MNRFPASLLLALTLAACGEPAPIEVHSLGTYEDPYAVPSARPAAPVPTPAVATAPAATVAVSPGYLTLAPASSQKLMAIVKGADGQITQNVAWSSSDGTVAEVNPTTGEVFALKEGWVTIVAAYALDVKIQALTTVHVVKDLAMRDAARDGVALKHPAHWTLREVASDNRDTKTIFSLAKPGPQGPVAWVDVAVAHGGYYERLVDELQTRTPRGGTNVVGPVVAGNKDGVGAEVDGAEGAVKTRNRTWIVMAGDYTYVVKARVATGGEAAPEARGEADALLGSLVFSAPAKPLDLAPPPTLKDKVVAVIDEALGDLGLPPLK